MAMRKNHIIHRSLALFFALWIMIISAGIVVDLHYCQNKIKNFAIYTEAESCHTGGDVCPLHKNDNCKMHNKSCSKDNMQCNSDDSGEDNCCHNEKKVIKSKVKYTFDRPAIAKTIDFAVVENTYLIHECNLSFHRSLQCIYVDRPPPTDIDFQALYQSYIL